MNMSDDFFKIYELLRAGAVLELSPQDRAAFEQIGVELQYFRNGRVSLKSLEAYCQILDPSMIDYPDKFLGQPEKLNILLNPCCATTLSEPWLTGGFVLAVTEWQSVGQGQYNRSWHSRFGQQIQFTLGPMTYHCEIPPSLLLAWATLNASLKKSSKELYFKWPNDIYTEKGKVAGMLIQQEGDQLTFSVGCNWTYESLESGVDCLMKKKDHAFRREEWVSLFLQSIHEAQIRCTAQDIVFQLQEYGYFSQGELIGLSSVFYPNLDRAYFEHIDLNGGCVLRTEKGELINMVQGQLRKII